MHIKDNENILTSLNYEGRVKSSGSSQQPMRHWGQASVGLGPGQELVSPSNWGKAFLIVVHGSMDTGSSIQAG
jgi:hypothetical protein